jgi:hypothetical protein
VNWYIFTEGVLQEVKGPISFNEVLVRYRKGAHFLLIEDLRICFFGSKEYIEKVQSSFMDNERE